MNIIKKPTYVLACIACITLSVATVITGCENDDLFDLDATDYYSAANVQTRAGIDMLEYLKLDSYDFNKWSDSDFIIIGKAIGRIGLSFDQSKKRYAYNVGYSDEINMSDTLYKTIVNMFEHTNKILNEKTSKKIKRRKLMSGDIVGVNPICVPIAISNMGQGAIPYQQACDTCTKYCPNWYNQGGVYSTLVGPIIRKITPVISRNDMADFCSDANLNQCVLLINRGGVIDHAVNATYYTVLHDDPEGGVFSYIDFCSNNPGAISPSQVTCVYTFN